MEFMSSNCLIKDDKITSSIRFFHKIEQTLHIYNVKSPLYFSMKKHCKVSNTNLSLC